MTLRETYSPRYIRFLELWENAGWRMKLYSITLADKGSNERLGDAVKRTAAELLPQPALTRNHYGVGMIIIHEGHSYDFIVISYWAYDTELKQHTLMRASSSDVELELLGEQDLSHDVWDIRLLAFERGAWVEHVLTAPEPDLEAYLQAQLTEII